MGSLVTHAPTSSAEAHRIEEVLDSVLQALRFELVLACDRAGIDLASVLKNATPRVQEALSHESRQWQRTQSALSNTSGSYTIQLLQAAERLNTRIPSYIVSMLSKALRRRRKQLSSSTVALLGMTPRSTTSPLPQAVYELLKKRGVVVRTFDPDTALEGDLATALQDADAALIVRAHPVLASLTPFHFMRAGVSTVVDAHNCLRKEDFYKSGVHYAGLGRGSI